MKKFLTICFVLSCLHVAFSQSGKQGSLYLKSGAVIKGIITEMDYGSSYKIVTPDNRTYMYQVEEVERVSFDGNTSHSGGMLNNSNTPNQSSAVASTKSGLTGILKVGPLFFRAYTASVIVGYDIKRMLVLGLGASADIYWNIGVVDPSIPSKGKDLFLPYFFDLRGFSGTKKASFMWCIDIGYAPLLQSGIHYLNWPGDPLNYNKTAKGGAYYSTGVGVKFNSGNKVSYILELGLKIQNYTVEEYRTPFTNTINWGFGTNGTNYYTYGPTEVNLSKKTTVTPYLNFGIKF